MTQSLKFIHDKNNKSTEKTITVDSEGEDERDVTVPDSTTDMQVNVAIDVDKLELFYLETDRDITIETNDGTTPGDTLQPKGGTPIVWTPNMIYSNPFTVDVTAFFITNNSGGPATVKIRTGQDATP